jgi:hypothetical protein
MLPAMKSPSRPAWLFACILALVLAGAPAGMAGPACCTAATPPPVAPIAPAEFLGWPQAFRLQSDQAEAVLVPAVGRLVFFSARGIPNPLRLEPGLHGKTPDDGARFFNLGGDWLWPVAQARWAALSDNGQDWPPPAVLADAPWTCSAWTDAEGAPCALMTREYGEPLNILVSRLFRLEPASAALVVQQRIERTEASAIPVVLWNISQIAGAEQVVLPVDAHSKFRGGLKTLMGRKPPRTRLVPCGDAAVYQVGAGTETKLGSDSPRGWIAAARGTHVILESVVNTAPGDFPDGGCILELYSNHGLGYSEIETLSPEVNLAPGQVLENTLRIELAASESPLPACELADFVRSLAGE